MAISTIRHQEIFNARANDSGISIIGAGAVGSRVFETLVSLGLTRIKVYDFDIVEEHNLANQLYGFHDLGSLKVDALKRWTKDKLGYIPDGCEFINEKVTPETQISGSVFLLVDSLESRGLLAKSFYESPDVFRVIDTRMAATHGNIYVFNPHTQLEPYLATLSDDSEAEVSACGSPFSVTPTVNILANMAVWQFIHHKTNPGAGDAIVNLFLQPFAFSMRNSL